MLAADVATALLALPLLVVATLLLAWRYFRRYRMTRPPIGVMTLGDVVVQIGGIVLIPYLYFGLPIWLVGFVLALGALVMLQLLVEPVLPGRGRGWLVALGLVAADVLLAWRMGTSSLAFLAVNNVVLILLVIAVSNLWAQSGLKARDLAMLAAALTLYDLVATGLLPLTSELIARLARMPFTPLLAWPLAGGQWVGVGLGDLLLAAAGALVFHKAFGRAAGRAAMAVTIAAVAVVLAVVMSGAYRGTFPVMVVLGPLLLAQYLAWSHINGREQTFLQFSREMHTPST